MLKAISCGVSAPFESAFAKASEDKLADKIGFDWVCIGFVFSKRKIRYIFIFLC